MATTSYPHKLHLSAPLPFVGQKRMFAKQFIEVIKQYPKGTVFVDLFGGSGLLFHITKYHHPESRVIYNDFDNYRFVLLHIEAPDEASHMRSFQKKKEILEKIDRLVLAPLLKFPYNIDVTVQSDHATSSLSGLHLTNPVEVVKFHINKCQNFSNR